LDVSAVRPPSNVRYGKQNGKSFSPSEYYWFDPTSDINPVERRTVLAVPSEKTDFLNFKSKAPRPPAHYVYLKGLAALRIMPRSIAPLTGEWQ
jgi:hypothetical protein